MLGVDSKADSKVAKPQATNPKLEVFRTMFRQPPFCKAPLICRDLSEL